MHTCCCIFMVMIVLKNKMSMCSKIQLENVFEKENGFFSPLSPLGLVSQPPRPLSLSWAAAQPAFLPLSPLSHRQARPACQFLPPPPQLLSLSLSAAEPQVATPPAPHDLHPPAPLLPLLEPRRTRAALLAHSAFPPSLHRLGSTVRCQDRRRGGESVWPSFLPCNLLAERCVEVKKLPSPSFYSLARSIAPKSSPNMLREKPSAFPRGAPLQALLASDWYPR